MKREVKDAWLRALRSGKYLQGDGHLARIHADDTRSHCCLGILCELAVEAGALDAERREEEGDLVLFGHEDNYLPPAVREWSGLPSSDPFVERECAIACLDGEDKDRAQGACQLARPDRSTISLSVLNDAQVSFEGIARIIEKCTLVSM